MKFSPIKSGKFSVEIDLNRLPYKSALTGFEEALNSIFKLDKENFPAICSLNNGVLHYQSETLLPRDNNSSKKKVLLVFGNPAIHSVKKGMFFYSKADSNRHSMWGKLAKAGLVRECNSEHKDSEIARQEEAAARRDMILKGKSSDDYLVGMTVFYSFPTPVENGFRYSNVLGVERLFAPILDWITQKETERILSYPFSDGAELVFVQRSSYERFCKQTGFRPTFWPVRGKGASGESLGKLLSVLLPVS